MQTTLPFPRQALILAAGLGTRLRPLTNTIPKPVLPLGGVPMILFNLFWLKKAGVPNITINLHHQGKRLKECLTPLTKLGVQLKFSEEKKILGTAGGIAQALDHMKPDPTFVLNGDVISTVDLHKMFQLHQKNQAQATLACVPPDRMKVKNFVYWNQQGKIQQISPKPPHNKKIHKGIFSGVHLIEPQLFKDYPRGTFGCVVRQVYDPALKDGKILQAYEHRQDWWDLGSLNELKRVDQSLWQGTISKNLQQLWQEVYQWAAPLFHRP